MRKQIIRLLKYIGIGVLILTLIFFGLVIYPFQKIAFPAKDYDVLVIKNISVIDVKGSCVYNGQNVVVRDSVIESISNNPIDSSISLQGKIKAIDGTHHYLLPALWDMHVHLTRQAPHIAYPAFIHHGITHVRDMRGAHKERDPFAGVQSRLEKWNREVNSFSLLGPRLHGLTSFAVDGPHPMYKGLPSFFNCATPADARRLVAYFKQHKVALIKVYNNIPREAFFVLMQEAKTVGIAVAGHKPVSVSTTEASNAGMKSLEHARFFIWDSFKGSDQLMKERDPLRKVNTHFRQRMLVEHDSLKLQENFATFRRNGTWYCPTHLTRKDEAFAADKQYRGRYKNINPLLRFLSFEDLDAILQEDSTAFGRKVFKNFYLKGLEVSGKASRAGVKILAGSDVPELPGSSLHEELMELSKAGLTSFEVLRTATLHPAQYYGLDSLYGSVEKGKRADMMILSANPLQNIENTKAITGVILDGIYIDEPTLSNLEARVADRQKSIRMSAKLLWDMLIYMTL